MPFRRNAVHHKGPTNIRDRYYSLLAIEAWILCVFALWFNIVCVGCFGSRKIDETSEQSKPTQAKEPSDSGVDDSEESSINNENVSTNRNPVDSGIDSSKDSVDDALAGQEEDNESTEPLGDECPFPSQSGVVDHWDSADELKFDNLLGVTGTDLVAQWSCDFESPEGGPYTGNLGVNSYTSEVAAVLDKPIDEISDSSSLDFDSWFTPMIEKDGIVVLRSRETGCYAAIRFDDIFIGFDPNTHRTNFECFATISWFFAGASADFSGF